MQTRSLDYYGLPQGRHAIAWWLLLCCALVAAIVLVGGATRLTGSGLSIVVWEPIIGIIPPLSERAWLEAFEQYRQFPEYQQRNLGMSLEEFRFIFWWEYWHRVLGRLIGLVYFAGLVYFLLTRRLGTGLTAQLIALLILGGLQGLLGWYMVTSGLVDDPQVSQYRLTAHLGLAVLIFAWMFLLALRLLQPRELKPIMSANRGNALAGWSWLLIVLIALTIISGGFVAGTRAGFMLNTFPLMGDQWVPAGLWALDPAWLNLFENPVMIQFVHRLLAITTFLAITLFWLAGWMGARSPHGVHLHVLMLAAILQVTLGISTLVMEVPTLLAVAHQGGALLLLAVALYSAHTLAR